MCQRRQSAGVIYWKRGKSNMSARTQSKILMISTCRCDTLMCDAWFETFLKPLTVILMILSFFSSKKKSFFSIACILLNVCPCCCFFNTPWYYAGHIDPSRISHYWNKFVIFFLSLNSQQYFLIILFAQVIVENDVYSSIHGMLESVPRYTLHCYPPIVLHNYLPYPIFYRAKVSTYLFFERRHAN